ncbi:UDP-glycosyltransferase 83A1-like [Humulus lupulus]|uniref:UDP-glycosyltransferase 83A1-like n=1 Tax=Humulus lupulus TaxID=3486 RepID=UPI002B4128A2|nr:UDP-glycosyltransferase 83A1-like [Humulus lupulus]
MSHKKPRVMAVPFPAQGHVKPLLFFSDKLAQHGFRVTFVYNEHDHKQILSAMNDCDRESNKPENIEFVSVPDGLSPEDRAAGVGNVCQAVLDTLPAELEKLIETINGNTTSDDDKISCVILDFYLGCALKVATKMGIPGAIFCPSSAVSVAYTMNMPKLIRDGIVDDNGSPTKAQIIQLSLGMPSMDTSKLPWKVDNLVQQKAAFEIYLEACNGFETAHWCMCNTTYDIEPDAFSLFPKLLPIGPLLAEKTSSSLDISGSQFWAEDTSCLNWLDQHKPRSVIYVAFGSFASLEQYQFLELAHGLELTGRPFLWVVRPGIISNNEENNEFDPFEFLGGNNDFRKIVNWAPQQKVLKHPSIACFVSHCGWNSTMEGLNNGVPFLCWPYFADQFLDKDYICDFWKVGMGFVSNENGIITSEEVRNKVEKLLSDVDIRERSLEFKKMGMKNIGEDGVSSKNFNNFVKWLEAL